MGRKTNKQATISSSGGTNVETEKSQEDPLFDTMGTDSEPLASMLVASPTSQIPVQKAAMPSNRY